MNKNISGLAIISTLLLSTSGCAPIISGAMNMNVTDEAVNEKTAKYFGVERKGIVVSQIEKGMLETTYKTMHGGKLYNCQIYYGEVDCKQPGN